MEDNNLLVHHNNNASSTGDGRVPGQGLQEAAFFVLWGGVFLFLLIWLWMGLKSFVQATLPDPRRQHSDQHASNSEGHVQKLSRSERRQRLVKYFENGKHEMVSYPFLHCHFQILQRAIIPILTKTRFPCASFPMVLLGL